MRESPRNSGFMGRLRESGKEMKRTKSPRWDATEVWVFRFQAADGTTYVEEHLCVDAADAEREVQACAETLGLTLLTREHVTNGQLALLPDERPLRTLRGYADYDAD